MFLLLIDKVRDRNSQDIKGRTPLHYAVIMGQLKICKTILNKITEKNPKDKNNYTPLHMAAMEGHAEVFNLIIPSLSEFQIFVLIGWAGLI